MGKRTYPPAPDMRLASTQQMTDGELFYVILLSLLCFQKIQCRQLLLDSFATVHWQLR
jgi:hypothetical protein